MKDSLQYEGLLIVTHPGLKLEAYHFGQFIYNHHVVFLHCSQCDYCFSWGVTRLPFSVYSDLRPAPPPPPPSLKRQLMNGGHLRKGRSSTGIALRSAAATIKLLPSQSFHRRMRVKFHWVVVAFRQQNGPIFNFTFSSLHSHVTITTI